MKKETETSAAQHKTEGEKGAKRIIRRGRKPSAKAERETKETETEKQNDESVQGCQRGECCSKSR